MALDALEKDHLRRKMATRMGSFSQGSPMISCVSGHYYFESHGCDLCDQTHGNEILVVKNRAGKKLRVAVSCLREMIRFRVVDVEDLPRWLEKLGALRVEAEKRRAEEQVAREEERKRLERKVIVRKRTEAT